MKTFFKLVCHTVDRYKVLLLTGGLLFAMNSCVTEIIPNENGDEAATLSAKEGNFSLNLIFKNYGEKDSTQNVDALPATHSLEPETDVIKLDDDLYIYATLAVDPVDKTPAVKTRKFETGAKLRVVVYREDPGPVYTYVYDTVYYIDSNNQMVRDGSTNKINLPAAKYKITAYSYNTTTVPPAYNVTIQDIDPINDLIWGQSVSTQVNEGMVNQIDIKMYHKLSQVKLVATTGQAGVTGPAITAFNGVIMPGYKLDLTTLDGTLTKKAPLDQIFTFTVPGATQDTVKSNTRTVYTGTPGDMPTIIKVGGITVDGKTRNDFLATFAKALQSGYSYTMTMNIGKATDLSDNIPAGFTPYVGAFWKASQTGERLIRLPRIAAIDSVWTAQVIQGVDWISLDKLPSVDPNINTSSATLGNNFNNTYDLPSATASTFVSGFVRASGSPGFQTGDDQIYFRIGLKSQYTPTTAKPARYGLVLLTYGNNKYRNRIWIRQGEGDDYLFSNSDNVNSGGLAARTVCRQFSPYNLTVPDGNMNQQVYQYGTTTGGTTASKFTEYPTQAGAFFQWANDVYTRYAWNPITIASPLWDGTHYSAGLWTDASSLQGYHETCPAGYRRPTDGPTDTNTDMISATDMALSEMRQSLWQNPQSGSGNSNVANSTWGYYADGFFDRMPIGYDPTHTNANSTVSVSTNDVAYVGRLFYNPNNFASLFFPAAGVRDMAYGSLGVGTPSPTGTTGFYWTSSTYLKDRNNNNSDSWFMLFSNTAASQMNFFQGRLTGNSIRCVVGTVEPLNVQFAESLIPFVGAFWKANQTGERLIRLSRNTDGSMDGTWTATVTSGDFIILDRNMTSDPNVGWRTDVTPIEAIVKNGNDPGFDATYAVTGNATTVSGILDASHTGIYFRIGLTGTLSSGVRYGVVTLRYKNETITQNIYIRQGEDPDYAPGQSSGALWSVRNLGNAKNLMDYPTQAGYLYQWSNTPATAWSPVNPIIIPTPPWNNNYDMEDFSLGNSSPAGYKLPVSTDISTMLTANRVVGYYADGWFDRRQIGQSVTYGAVDNSMGISTDVPPLDKTAVSATTTNVAYIGTLFFSPTNSASLFFPIAGYRFGDVYSQPGFGIIGGLAQAGSYTCYWASDSKGGPGSGSYGFPYSLGLNNTSGAGLISQDYSDYGFPVRCVKDMTVTLSVDPTNIYFAYNNDGSNPAYVQTINVTTNQPSWSTSGNPGWLTITPTSGSGTSFTVVPNSVTNVTRTATITVSAGAATPVTVNVVQYGDAGGGAEIIYYDPVTQTLKLGRWGYEITDIKTITFFRFGSVIGLDNTTAVAAPAAPATANLPATAIKFNPTTTVTTIQVQKNGPVSIGAPNYFSSHGLGNAWNTTIANSPKVSDDAYHNLVNVKAGKGDPCRLVGMTPAQIQAFTTDAQLYAAEKGWRTPSAEENAKYMKGPNPNWSSWTATGALSYSYNQGNTTGGTTVANFYVNSNGTTGSGTTNYYSNPNVFWTPVIQGATPNSANGEKHPTPGFRHDSDNGTPLQVGTVGDFWSSTPYSGAGVNDPTAYAALITQTYIFPAGAHTATFYGSVRCVRKW